MEETVIRVEKIKIEPSDDLENCTKEELISRIKVLHAHNIQLKNILQQTSHPKKSHKEKPKKPFDFSKVNFRRVLLKLCYLGWDYQGYVVQEHSTNTIEHHLFNALLKTCLIPNRETSEYHRCGRTDKGVSSFGQVISIKLRSRLSKEDMSNIDEELDYCGMLNRVLPDDIKCFAWCNVDKEYSARFDCKSRTYKYYFPKGNLNIHSMKVASMFLGGTHDYRNLCKMDVGNGVVNFVRTIHKIDINPVDKTEKLNEYSMHVITIKGQAFLWHQIRCIMGILLLVGQGKEEPGVFRHLLDVENNPRKPEYNMASEIPLNLFFCEYEAQNWKYNKETLRIVIENLQKQWASYSIKSTQIKSMLWFLEKAANKIGLDLSTAVLSECLIQGVKPKSYVPIMERQMCDSLEKKIQHYVEKNRLKIKTEENPEVQKQEEIRVKKEVDLKNDVEDDLESDSSDLAN